MAVEPTRTGRCAVIALNGPEALNALSFDILRELGAAIDEVVTDRTVRALLFAGDKAFCAGADIKELRDRALIDQKRGAEPGQAVVAGLDRLPVPSIALVNGYAFGGGAELSMACTFRLASPGAIFGPPQIKLGLIPGYGGTQRLLRLIGEARALEIIMTGRNVRAGEAERIGLVNRVVKGALMAAGFDLAAAFTRYSLRVLEFARRAVQRAGEATLGEGLQIEADVSTQAFQTADLAEGMATFEQNRMPVFRNA